MYMHVYRCVYLVYTLSIISGKIQCIESFYLLVRLGGWEWYWEEIENYQSRLTSLFY